MKIEMTYEEACYLARLVGKELHSSKLTHKADADYITARNDLIDRLLDVKVAETLRRIVAET